MQLSQPGNGEDAVYDAKFGSDWIMRRNYI